MKVYDEQEENTDPINVDRTKETVAGSAYEGRNSRKIK